MVSQNSIRHSNQFTTVTIFFSFPLAFKSEWCKDLPIDTNGVLDPHCKCWFAVANLPLLLVAAYIFDLLLLQPVCFCHCQLIVLLQRFVEFALAVVVVVAVTTLLIMGDCWWYFHLLCHNWAVAATLQSFLLLCCCDCVDCCGCSCHWCNCLHHCHSHYCAHCW